KIGQGKANAAKFLGSNPALSNEIEGQIRAQMLNIDAPIKVPAAAQDEESLSEE
ncbi:MAG TPA: DNA recombination/repair protein RecA, partial [Candidatus Ozemobacteraceae bacterium]|nr:DNA recombination/repair protein RecA [Candidatus Ozemobacteraceae bacterium]